MVDHEIVDYLKEGLSRGFSLKLLKRKLEEGGFDQKDIEEAEEVIKSMKNENKEIGMRMPKKSESKNFGMSNQKNGIFKKIGMAIAHPTQLFEDTRGESIWKTLLFYYAILIVPFVLTSVLVFVFLASFIGLITTFLFSGSTVETGLLGFLVGGSSLIMIGMLALLSFIVLPAMSFISAGILHLFVKIFKGEGGYSDTYRAMIYSMTPALLLFFVPLVGIWSFVLMLFGLSVNHRITKMKAFLILLTLALLSFVIWLVFYLIALYTISPVVN